MDIFLGRVTQQAMNYAIRSGISITAGYALRQSARLMTKVDEDDKDEFQALQERLESKIKILAPAIDMIELISARGNTLLDSAVDLTKSLRQDVEALGRRISAAADQRENVRSAAVPRQELEVKQVLREIKRVLGRIEDAVPLVNLAITTSGVNLSSSLPTTVSPSRLLQASTFLTAGDTQYGSGNFESVQIGPTFVLSLYMLFAGNIRPSSEEEVRSTTWKEVLRKARLKLVRVPLDSLASLPAAKIGSLRSAVPENSSDAPLISESRPQPAEFAYQIVLIEDLDDDLVHTFEDGEPPPSRYDDVPEAGIREAIPIHQISKIFYADTGKILNISSDGDSNSPVLLLKRDIHAHPPRRMADHPSDSAASPDQFSHSTISHIEQQDGRTSEGTPHANLDVSATASALPSNKPQGLTRDLDPEWLAFEVYQETVDSDDESQSAPSPGRSPSSREQWREAETLSALSRLSLRNEDLETPSRTGSPSIWSAGQKSKGANPGIPVIRTSLSLLEVLLRLLSLQQFQQASHLAIPDELLNFFLSESATTGAATGDEAGRRRLRNEARHRVGFDPYDESPIKRRGEDYQYRGGTSQAGDETWSPSPARPTTESGDDTDEFRRSTDGHAPSDEGYGTRNLNARSPLGLSTPLSSSHFISAQSRSISRLARQRG